MTAGLHYSGPYLRCARFLSTWYRVRILLACSLGVSFAIMVISGVQMAGGGGSFAASSGIGGWTTSICGSIPYMYLKPFSFTVGSGSTPSYCGWPDQNTDIRVVGSVFGFLFTFALFFPSKLSNFARTIFIVFTSLHFASFVLDASQSVAGSSACTNKFPNTSLGSSIGGGSVTCNAANYAGLTVLNFIQVVLYYLLFETWSMCSNLYNKTADDDEDDEDDKPKKKRRKNRGGDDEDGEDEEGGGAKSTRNPLQDFDEDGGEDEDGNPRKKGFKKVSDEDAEALGKKKSWCPLL